MLFDPMDDTQALYNGYGPAAIPDPRDAFIDTFVTQLTDLGASAVNDVRHKASLLGKRVLLAYAERMATQAVRESESGFLHKALVAIVAGGLDRSSRDELLSLVLVEATARKLEVPLRQLFDSLSTIVGEPGASALQDWLRRPASARSLEAFHFREEQSRDGFRYIFIG